MRQQDPFTLVVYCATPRIEKSQTGFFSLELFAGMCRFYLEGLLRVIEAVRREGHPLWVLYPSTVFLDEMNPDFPEYVAAKAAGEAMCVMLEKKMKGLRIRRPRLPRVGTDQTASLVQSDTADVVAVLLPLLREIGSAAL